ncbi:nucleotide-binding domain-containing protein [Stipitochalara longipes BDJ]|nr:nucleotide-binding domain-containing protein [Stipitochalara longipes BDJ]
MAAVKRHVVVLGAGISGLQTSLSLLQRGHHVTIVAAHTPGDFSPAYTSPWAGGHWRSHAGTSPSDAALRSYDSRTYQAWTEMLNTNHANIDSKKKAEAEQEMGIGFRTARYYWGKDIAETEGRDGRGIWFRDVIPEFCVLDLEEMRMNEVEKIPESAMMGIKYKSICFDPPKYLVYLFRKVQELGAKVMKTSVDTTSGLVGVVRSCKAVVEKGKVNEVFAIVNCTGLAARHFLHKEEAEKLFPIRGQTILVQGEAEMTRTFVGLPGAPDSEMLYVVPRPGSGSTILGGCKQVGSWSEVVDADLNDRILTRIKRFGLCDELRGDDGEFEVLSYQVGFRPGRKGGPRVEIEGDSQIDGVWVAHNYGHSGAGYQNSVGCAEEVVRLLSRAAKL